MKHRHGNRILSRTAPARTALLRNLSTALLQHGSIVTSEAKAKELRRFFEPLVTKAKQGETLHVRRQLLRALPKTHIDYLYAVAKSNAKRPGGYIRLTRLPITRSDAASMMRIDLVGKP